MAQAKVLSKKYRGLTHALLSMIGFLLLAAMFFPILSVVTGYIALLFGAGLVLLWYRRANASDPPLETAWEDSFVFAVIVAMTASGFLMMGANPWAWPSPVGHDVLSHIFEPLGPKALVELYPILWLIHSALVFMLIAYIPYSRLMHLITSPLNIYYAPIVPKGQLSTPFDLKQMMETGQFPATVGAAGIDDFTWRQKLSFDACTLCVRCTDACPATASGTKLSPMHLILKLKNLQLQSGGTSRSLHGETIDAEELWACTTCRACVEQCPVLIDHVGAIVDMRRHLIAEGKVDRKKRDLLTSLNNVANPYGLPAFERMRWAEGLNLRTMQEDSDVDILYWVGCAGSYDPRNQNVSRAMIRILRHAGVKFGVLGNEEKCNCEVARRIGEEGRFQQAALELIELFQKYRIRRIVTQCPHCYNTFKNDYPKFGLKTEVIHHSEFIAGLIEAGRLRLKPSETRRVAFHDPCYLGRYNDVYEAPRGVISSNSSLQLVEIKRHHQNSFCCGAGGANFWYTVEQKRKASVIRFEEAMETKCDVLGTACPFCTSMFEEASNAMGTSETTKVKDIAEIVVDTLEENG
jgi:Fe-S oxidoreductase